MLILLRHGRTVANADARVQGNFDSPLDEVGRAQARAAGESIRSRWSVDRVITSDLQRTRDTATEAGFGHLPTEVDECWREIDFGTYDNRSTREVIGELGARWSADIGFVPEGGESMAAMHERITGAAAPLVEQARTETILVVTHATPIKSVVAHLLGGDARMILAFQVNLASTTSFVNAGPEFLLSEYNWRPDEVIRLAGIR